MNWKISITLTINLLYGIQSVAQEVMPLKDVISEALAQNFDIAIASNNTLIAKNQATKAQAGYYPTVSLNGNANYSINNTNLKFAGGLPDVEVDGAQNTSLGSNIGFNYVIFNGFGKVPTYQNLMFSHKLNEVQAQVIAENLVLDILNKYLDIQENCLNLEAANSNLSISRDRLQRATLGNKNGVKTKLDVLSAQVDFNNDNLQVQTILTNISKQKASVNILMGREPGNPFRTSETIEVPADLKISSIEDQALENNSTILLAQLSQSLATNQSKMTEGIRLPTLSASGYYGYNTSQNGAGIILSQSNLGFNGGLTLSMPIFNGNQLSTAMKNADISLLNSDLELEKAKLAIKNQLYAAQADNELLLKNLELQEENIALASTALERAQQSYNNGQISYNDLRAAQLNLFIAQNSLVQAKINVVKLYYTISRISGGLLN